MSDSVFALAVSGSDLYAGGSFTAAGGVSANYIAKWNGSAWAPLGSGTDTPISVLAVSGSDLYAGGIVIGASKVIAKWNGSTWSGLGLGMNGPVGGRRPLRLAEGGEHLRVTDHDEAIN